MKAAVKIIRGDTHAVGSQFLLDSGMHRPALFGKRKGLPGKAGIVAEGLVESRFHDPLSVGGVQARVAKRALCDAQGIGRARARHDARSEIGVVFGARAGIQRQPRNRLPAHIEKARLIVAAHVQCPTELRNPFSTSYS